jgi:hypothetical protein
MMQEIENLKTLNFFQTTYEKKYLKKFELNHLVKYFDLFQT